MAGGGIPTQCLLIISSFPFPLLLSQLAGCGPGCILAGVMRLVSADQPTGACRLEALLQLPLPFLKTEHLVARTFFSVLSCRACLSTLSRAHVCVAQGLMTQVTGVVCCLVAHPKSLHLTACFTKHFSTSLTPSLHFSIAFADCTHNTTADWNQEYSLCHCARRKPVWPPGRNTSSLRL